MNKKTLFPTDDDDFISFNYGAPGKSLMPIDVMAKASAEFWENADSNYTYLQYGPAIGALDYLDELAKFLSAEYSTNISVDCLALTSGASQSFSNILSLFTTAETKIIVEDPTYFLALQVLQDHGFACNKFINVPTDSNGLDVDYLEYALTKNYSQKNTNSHNDAKKFDYLLYFVPIFSNPTGHTTNLQRLEKLLVLARTFNILVVCDDIYPLLLYDESTPTPPRLITLDHAANCQSLTTTSVNTSFGNVISNNSFSKILSPGLRIGWIEASPHLIAHLSRSGLMNSGGAANHIVSGLVVTCIRQGGLHTHLDKLRRVYAARMQALCDYLDAHLPACVRVDRPKGGFFVWITIPEGHNTLEILNACNSSGNVADVRNHILYRDRRLTIQKMSFAPGNYFTTTTQFTNCLRLSFAFYETDALLVGAQRLCQVLKEAVL